METNWHCFYCLINHSFFRLMVLRKRKIKKKTHAVWLQWSQQKAILFSKSFDCDGRLVWLSIIKMHCSMLNISVYHRWCNTSISLAAYNWVYAHKSQFKVLKQSLSSTYHCLQLPNFLYKTHPHHINNASTAHYNSYHLHSFPYHL